MQDGAHLYYHSPCFDGIASCVLAWDFLETRKNWQIAALHAVNYDVRQSWLSTSLAKKSAVVDFLYHTDASFWADHHATTFLTSVAEDDFKRRLSPCLTYDPQSGSCASLLWGHLADAFGYRDKRYEGLVQWADRIDSARYASVEEAVFGTHPALRINATLDLNEDPPYCDFLVRLLKADTLEHAAGVAEVKTRSDRAQALVREGLERFTKGARLAADGIAVFDVDSTGVIINRYAPYCLFPDARYSAGIIRASDGATITGMRNPWREFPSVHFGQIFARFGGGGHQRVGSLVLTGDRAAQARSILDQIISEIRRQEGTRFDTKSELL